MTSLLIELNNSFHKELRNPNTNPNRLKQLQAFNALIVFNFSAVFPDSKTAFKESVCSS